MKTIWKFIVPVEDQPVLVMPEGARVLSVGYQEPDIMVWALVDPDAPRVKRPLSLRGTGHRADGLDGVPFIGTVRHPGTLVFHLWDGVPE